MLKVGITGGIGSGKTTVCKIFEVLGVPVFYADTEAKRLMTTDEILIKGVKDTFGEISYHADGSLNNKHIASIVFQNQAELEKLNAIVHPAVFRAFERWENALPKNIPYSLKEAALLFESGSWKMSDVNILVTAPVNLKLSRVMSRDQVTQEQVLARMDKQLSDEEKALMADYFIENTENESVILQVLTLHQEFQQC